MPPRTADQQAASKTTAQTRKPATGRGRGARGDTSPAPGTQDEAQQTLAEHLGARLGVNHGGTDDDPITRSFHSRVGIVERLKATADGIQHRTYDTELGDRIPKSLSALADEAFIAICSYYEDLLNGGKEFRRVRGSLRAGPTSEGARRGAAKRRATAAANKPAAPADAE